MDDVVRAVAFVGGFVAFADGYLIESEATITAGKDDKAGIVVGRVVAGKSLSGIVSMARKEDGRRARQSEAYTREQLGPGGLVDEINAAP